jgi:hypothetical protein
VEGKKQNRVEISKSSAALEILDDDVHINWALETIREHTKISAKDSLGYYVMK